MVLPSAAQDSQDFTEKSITDPTTGSGRPRILYRKPTIIALDLHTPRLCLGNVLGVSGLALPSPLLPPQDRRQGTRPQRVGVRGQLRRSGWAGGQGTHLVIPTADAELATQAVGARAVIHTRAVLGREAESAHPSESAQAPQLPPTSPPTAVLSLGSTLYGSGGDGPRMRGIKMLLMRVSLGPP